MFVLAEFKVLLFYWILKTVKSRLGSCTFYNLRVNREGELIVHFHPKEFAIYLFVFNLKQTKQIDFFEIENFIQLYTALLSPPKLLHHKKNEKPVCSKAECGILGEPEERSLFLLSLLEANAVKLLTFTPIKPLSLPPYISDSDMI